MFRNMLLTRAIEERGNLLFKAGKLPGSYYTGRGQEAISVGMATPLRKGPEGDWLSPWIRDLGSYLVHGVPVWRMFAQFMGKEGSTTRGKDGNLHIGGQEWNIPCQVSHMADMIPLTVGAALAYKQRGEDRVAVTSFGDGATSRGDFHEGLNIAAVLEVPAVFVAENNRWAYTTPISKQTKVTDLYKKALGYGIPAVEVDGNDVIAVYTAMTEAVAHCRAGRGPRFIECKTYRMAGHAAHDKYESYMPMELLAEWSDKDPLKRLEQALREDRAIDDQQLEGIRSRVKDEVLEAVERADADGYADPAEAHQGVFAEAGDA
jgi:pyruvate dehydrogenase E1 component alpha subunit